MKRESVESRLYLEAAKLIDAGEAKYSCVAVCAGGFDALRRDYRLRRSCREKYMEIMLDGNTSPVPIGPTNDPKARNLRVLLLLMMAACCEDF